MSHTHGADGRWEADLESPIAAGRFATCCFVLCARRIPWQPRRSRR